MWALTSVGDMISLEMSCLVHPGEKRRTTTKLKVGGLVEPKLGAGVSSVHILQTLALPRRVPH
jgi:hypothetical protein